MSFQMPPVNYVIEGPTDNVIVKRIMQYVGLPVGRPFGERGKPHLMEVLPDYNHAAKFMPWVAVIDLDQKPDCAPELVQQCISMPGKWMRLRVAVHAIEAWLLADGDCLADFLHVRRSQVPDEPDAEINPKITLVNLARKSTLKAIRTDMVPREGSGTSVGPGYTGRLIEFVTIAESRWRPEIAAQHSDSLRRCMAALQTLKDWKPET